MMLEAGSNPRARNRQGVTPLQLVDPANQDLRDVIRQHEFASQNAGDYVNVPAKGAGAGAGAQDVAADDDESDEDAEFSGSDEDERAEWERRRKEKGRK